MFQCRCIILNIRCVYSISCRKQACPQGLEKGLGNYLFYLKSLYSVQSLVHKDSLVRLSRVSNKCIYMFFNKNASSAEAPPHASIIICFFQRDIIITTICD